MFNENQNKIIKIRIMPSNFQHYKNKGFNCKLYDTIISTIDDLPEDSTKKIEVDRSFELVGGFASYSRTEFNFF